MLSFNSGLSALRSSQLSMDVIANNIANANTPGYHRQAVQQVESLPVYDGNFWRGTGVEIARINQIASRAIESALTNNIANVNRVDQSLQIARQVETSLLPSDGSIHQRIQQFFDEFHQLQGQPNSLTQRQIIVNRSQSLASEVNSVSADLNRLRVSARQQINQEVVRVNGQLDALADLNRRIAQAQANGQQPNSLLDNHQQLVNEIAQTIDIEAIPEEQGFTYQFAQNRVSITRSSFSIKAEYKTDGTVEFTQADGQFPVEFGGGRLAGLQHTLNYLVPGYEQQLDDLAASFIQAVDHVQSTGVGAQGPFELLTSHRIVNDLSVPLSDAGLPFEIKAGELYVTVHDLDSGSHTQNVIAIDPATQSLEDLAGEINKIPHLQAVIDSSTNALSIVATPGFGFDFAGQLPSEPDRSGITGKANIEFSGIYSGSQNLPLQFTVKGSGLVGVTEDLTLSVTDPDGNSVAEFNLGKGYEPGTALDLGNGIEISIDSGTLNDGDSFSTVAVADADTAHLLVGLGLNTFFEGSRANDIRVSSNIVDDPLQIAAGRSAFSGDGSNAARILGLREQPIVDGELSFENYLARMTSSIAIEVNELTALQSDLGAYQHNLQREREAISGVDPNEEMIQMLQYQRSFQAAVRVITTIDETLTELMRIVR